MRNSTVELRRVGRCELAMPRGAKAGMKDPLSINHLFAQDKIKMVITHTCIKRAGQQGHFGTNTCTINRTLLYKIRENIAKKSNRL